LQSSALLFCNKQIDSSHVESFWLFLISNLPKFVVNGSMESLLQKIERHFNPNFTKEDEDFSHLIQEVPYAIYDHDLEDFTKKLNEIFEQHEPWYPVISDRAMAFWNELIKLGSPISDSIIEFLKRDTDLEIFFLGDYPEHVASFYAADPHGIRNLWREKINQFGYRKFRILASLLRNGLLEGDKEEALDHIVRNVGNAIPPDKDIPCLLEHGYFTKYKSLVFREDHPLINQFGWGNNSEGSIGKHLDIIGLDENIVKVINNTFEYAPFPFKMRDALVKYFEKSRDKKDQYIAICKNLGIVPTSNLGF
jgi:hypothetical protein